MGNSPPTPTSEIEWHCWRHSQFQGVMQSEDTKFQRTALWETNPHSENEVWPQGFKPSGEVCITTDKPQLSTSDCINSNLPHERPGRRKCVPISRHKNCLLQVLPIQDPPFAMELFPGVYLLGHAMKTCAQPAYLTAICSLMAVHCFRFQRFSKPCLEFDSPPHIYAHIQIYIYVYKIDHKNKTSYYKI